MLGCAWDAKSSYAMVGAYDAGDDGDGTVNSMAERCVRCCVGCLGGVMGEGVKRGGVSERVCAKVCSGDVRDVLRAAVAACCTDTGERMGLFSRCDCELLGVMTEICVSWKSSWYWE